MTEPWVSIDEVALHLGVVKESVYRWIGRRGLPARKVGKLWKLKLSEVDAWMRSQSKAASDTSPRPLVMVVDDDELIRETVGEFLTDQGYATLLAADGSEALELLRSPAAPRPALILLDLVMPGMDGWEFRKAQSRDPALDAIPVLLITAERRLHLGPDVLWKPLDLWLLHDAVGRVLGGKS